MRRKIQTDEEPDPVGQLIVKPTMNIIQIDEVPDFHNNIRLTNIEDTKRLKKLDAFARRSLEYRRYMKYLKQNLNMNKCSYFQGISNTLGNVKIEIHHSPFTLFDITCAVANRQIADHGFADEFDVGDEVMKLHYQNLVGLIPVSPTVHELIHSESMDVDPRVTYGYWKVFIQLYKPYFTDAMLLKAIDIEAWDKVTEFRVPAILNTKYTMLNYSGVPLYKNLELEDNTSAIDELSMERSIQ